MAAMNSEICWTVMPVAVPKTGPIPHRQPKSAPRQNEPAVPRGDTRTRPRSDIGFADSKTGAGDTDSRIGANEMDTNTDPITKRK